NCDGGVVSLGSNLDSGATCGFAAAGDQSNRDPLLGPLADNGGPTQTQALLAGSPAIDAGSCANAAGVTVGEDQRGLSRPRDGDGDGISRCDVGALEAAPQAPFAATGLAVTAAAPASLTLGWRDNSANESGFRLRRKTGWTDSTASYSDGTTTAADATSYVNSGRAECTTYTYRLYATSATGEAAPSNIVSGTTQLKRPTTLATASPTPGGLALSWVDNSGTEEAVVVERKTGAGAFQAVGAVGPNATSFQDVGLTPGAAYTYRLRAMGLGCASPYSPTASGTAAARQSLVVNDTAD